MKQTEPELKTQLESLRDNLHQQVEILDSMLENCEELKGTSTKQEDRSKDGIYIMIGSSAFFLIGIPAGIINNNLTLVLVEIGVGLTFFILGLLVHLHKRKGKANA